MCPLLLAVRAALCDFTRHPRRPSRTVQRTALTTACRSCLCPSRAPSSGRQRGQGARCTPQVPEPLGRLPPPHSCAASLGVSFLPSLGDGGCGRRTLGFAGRRGVVRAVHVPHAPHLPAVGSVSSGDSHPLPVPSLVLKRRWHLQATSSPPSVSCRPSHPVNSRLGLHCSSAPELLERLPQSAVPCRRHPFLIRFSGLVCTVAMATLSPGCHSQPFRLPRLVSVSWGGRPCTRK